MGNWQDARDQCRSMGADLASIDNSAENDYIAALITQSKFTIFIPFDALSKESDVVFHLQTYGIPVPLVSLCSAIYVM